MGLLKLLFPNPSNDVKILIGTLATCGGLWYFTTSYAKEGDKKVKKELNTQVKELKEDFVGSLGSMKDQMVAQQGTIVKYLKEMKQDQMRFNGELKNAVKRNNDKLWELSREIRKN